MMKEAGRAIATVIAAAYIGHAEAGQFNTFSGQSVPVTNGLSVVGSQIRRYEDGDRYLRMDRVGFSLQVTDEVKAILQYGEMETKDTTEILSGFLFYNNDLGKVQVSLGGELRYDLGIDEIIRYNTMLKVGTEVKVGGVTLNPYISNLLQFTGDGDYFENRANLGVGKKFKDLGLEASVEAGYSDFEGVRKGHDDVNVNVMLKANVPKVYRAMRNKLRANRRPDQRRGR